MQARSALSIRNCFARICPRARALQRDIAPGCANLPRAAGVALAAACSNLGHCGRDCHDSLPVPLRYSRSLVSEQPTRAAAFGTLWRSKPQIRRNTNRSRPMKVRGVRGVHVGDRDRRSSGGPSALRPRSPTRAGVLPHEALHPFTGSLREEGSHEQHREKQQVSLE